MGINSDELPGLAAGDTQGQADDKGTPSQSASAYNLHNDPNFRVIQSEYERKLSQAKAEAEREAREKAQAQAERDAILSAVRTADPDGSAALLREARLAALEAEKAQRDREEAERQEAEANAMNWHAYHDGVARDMGLDPFARELVEAKQQAIAVGHDGPLTAARQALIAKKYSASAPAPQPEKERDEYALPPSGGSPSAGKRTLEQIDGELIDLLDEPTKNAGRIAALRQEKKQLSGR